MARLGLYSILGHSRLGMIGHASQFMEMQKLCKGNSRAGHTGWGERGGCTG